MTWLRHYQFRHYLRNSIWVLPTLGMLAAIAAVPVLHRVEAALGWEWTIEPDAARAVLGTLAPSMFTFIVFVCSGLLVAVQLATGQAHAADYRHRVSRSGIEVPVDGVRLLLHVLLRRSSASRTPCPC